MEALASRLLGTHACEFVPRHSRNLANEFRCYANYPSGLDAVSGSCDSGRGGGGGASTAGSS